MPHLKINIETMKILNSHRLEKSGLAPIGSGLSIASKCTSKKKYSRKRMTQRRAIIVMDDDDDDSSSSSGVDSPVPPPQPPPRKRQRKELAKFELILDGSDGSTVSDVHGSSGFAPYLKIRLRCFMTWDKNELSSDGFYEFVFRGPVGLIDGESGRGKTTLFQAIMWVLYGVPRSDVTPLGMNANVAKTCVCIQMVISPTCEICVERTRNPATLKVRVIEDGNRTEIDEMEVAQSYINDRFGSEDCWKSCSYIPQKVRSVFLDKCTAEEQKQVLRSLSNIDEQSAERLKTKTKTLLNEAERKLAELKTTMKAKIESMEGWRAHVAQYDPLMAALQTLLSEEEPISDRHDDQKKQKENENDGANNKSTDDNNNIDDNVRYRGLLARLQDDRTTWTACENEVRGLERSLQGLYERLDDLKDDFNRLSQEGSLKNSQEEARRSLAHHRERCGEFEQRLRLLNNRLSIEGAAGQVLDDVWASTFQQVREWISLDKERRRCLSIGNDESSGVDESLDHIEQRMEELTKRVVHGHTYARVDLATMKALLAETMEKDQKLLKIGSTWEERLEKCKRDAEPLRKIIEEEDEKDRCIALGQKYMSRRCMTCPGCKIKVVLSEKTNDLETFVEQPAVQKRSKEEIDMTKSRLDLMNRIIIVSQDQIERRKNYIAISEIPAAEFTYQKFQQWLHDVQSYQDGGKDAQKALDELQRTVVRIRAKNERLQRIRDLEGKIPAFIRSVHDIGILDRLLDMHLYDDDSTNLSVELIQKSLDDTRRIIQDLERSILDTDVTLRSLAALKLKHDKFKAVEQLIKDANDALADKHAGLLATMARAHGSMEGLNARIERIQKICNLLAEKRMVDELRGRIASNISEIDELSIQEQSWIERFAKLKQLKEILDNADTTMLMQCVDHINFVLQHVLPTFFEDEPITAQLVPFITTKNSQNVLHRPSLKVIYGQHNVERVLDRFSGGESDRISLALSLAMSTLSSFPFVFLDECLSSLDPPTRDLCIQSLRTLSPRLNKTFIVVCHSCVLGNFDHIIHL